MRHNGNCGTYLLVYVDDMLLVGSDANEIDEVKQFLHKKFSIKYMGTTSYFLGVEIGKTNTGIFLNQRKYVKDILGDAGMMRCKPTNIPMPKGTNLTMKEKLLVNVGQYRRLVGRLLYLNITRPDIGYYVQQLTQQINAPTTTH